MSTQLGNAKKIHREAGLQESFFLHGQRTELEINSRAGKIAEITECIDNIPWENLINGPLSDNITDDIFLETLVNNIRNDCIRYQIFIAKARTNTVSELKKKLTLLKTDYGSNQDEIFLVESALDKLIDDQLRHKLESSADFELLHSEKITPHFLNLAKGCKNEASLSSILDNDGRPFDSDAKRNDYIRSYYRDLYRPPPHLVRKSGRTALKIFWARKYAIIQS